MRANAPKAQSARTALADYAPTIAAMSGLALGDRAARRRTSSTRSSPALGIVMALAGFLLLGVSWPRNRWTGAPQVAMTARALALHCTLVPAILGIATLAGVDLPGAVWLLGVRPDPDLGRLLLAGLRLLAADGRDRAGGQHRRGDRAAAALAHASPADEAREHARRAVVHERRDRPS